MTPERKCITCGQPIRGRTDKKYCSDSCRMNYHTSVNSKDSYVRFVNQSLMRNRRILQQFLRNGVTTISKDVLLALGFEFNYITGLSVNDGGGQLYNCYEHCYELTEIGMVVLATPARRPYVVTRTDAGGNETR